jgi:pimeloyl-ACP methyl ester carboxylesterase
MKNCGKLNVALIVALVMFFAAGLWAPGAGAAAISEDVLVDSGDTKIFVHIRGEKSDAPVLLHLHGGPANPMGILSFEAYPGPALEKDFVMAYMHQRGVLESPSVPDSTLTVANHVKDVDAVVEYLRKKFGKNQISLIGHSWGGTLGFLYLLEHEDKIDKFIDAAGPLNMQATYLASYEMTLQWAQDNRFDRPISDLRSIGSPPWASYGSLLTKSLWSSEAYGSLTQNLSWEKVLEVSGYGEYDEAWGERQMHVNDVMFPELQSINVEDRVGALTTPLLVIIGRNDAEVPYFALKRSVKKYGGEAAVVILDNSHHLLYIDETDRFVEAVTEFLGK